MAHPAGRLTCRFLDMPYIASDTIYRIFDEEAHAVGRLVASRWDAAARQYEADFEQSEPTPGSLERFANHVGEDFIIEGQVGWQRLTPPPEG